MTDGGDSRAQLRSFLASCRERLHPGDVGLEDFGTRRRVRGLRRDEVARLARISTEYYVRLEQGRAGGVSDTVVRALGDALQLSEAERDHLGQLVKNAVSQHHVDADSLSDTEPPAELRETVAAIQGAAAFVRNYRLDVVAANRVAEALYASAGATGDSINLAEFIFLNDDARSFYSRWEDIAAQSVGTLRTQSARHPVDPGLAALIERLLSGSDEFKVRWERHEVRKYEIGAQVFNHPTAGELHLRYQGFDVRGMTDGVLIIYTGADDKSRRAMMSLL